MPWYPSAKACPAAIKPTVQCFFPTLYQVLFFDFSSFGEKLFFACAAMPRNRAKRGAKTAGAQSEDVPLFTRRRTGGEWVEVATLPHHQQAMPRNRAKRGAKTAGAQSEDVPLSTRRRTGGEWVEETTLPHHQQAIAAQSREARCKKQPERRALRPQARFGRNRRRRHLARR